MSQKSSSTISSSTTQLFLDLYDITNDLIILSDGATSLVITVSAMNFGLLSENEQDATIYAYAALLNSLSFPIQIVVRSQPKDVTGYLKKIQDQEQSTINPVYRQKIKEYRSFVESLVQEQNVLDKKFYIVIPLSAVEMGLTTQNVLPGAKNKPISSFEKNYIIEKARTNLIPRRDHLIDQLARIGLYSRQLNTQELIQMLYSSYNPESFEGQKVTDTSNYTTPLVQAKIQGDFYMNPNDINAQTAASPSTASVQPSAPTQSNTSMPLEPMQTPPTDPTMPPAASNPVQTSVPTPPVQPLMNDVASVTESPVVSTPPETPATWAPTTPAAAGDPQSLINKTLGEMPSAPTTPVTPATPTMPRSGVVTPTAPQSVPGVPTPPSMHEVNSNDQG